MCLCLLVKPIELQKAWRRRNNSYGLIWIETTHKFWHSREQDFLIQTSSYSPDLLPGLFVHRLDLAHIISVLQIHSQAQKLQSVKSLVYTVRQIPAPDPYFSPHPLPGHI
jgi:hypothetical protein